ncbi:MAG: hypothetical protein A3F12_00460 [Gammaproteobacteria bacterium RIFCSPHIGHO2_12_FULL_38_14]|nr:MAG: hypothetical protein A3F12_00460 [Gammaproteobacteria bacterium RIFCSPHIGHO2_12_FULL_38_14]
MTSANTKQPGASKFDRFEENEIDLRAIVNLVKHQYKLVIIITIAFMLAGFAYLKTRHPSYESTALIHVANSSMSSTLSDKGGSLSGIGGLSSGQSATEMVLLKSPYILADVAQEIGADISVSPKYNGYFARKLAQIRGEQISAKVSLLTLPDFLLGKSLILEIGKNDSVRLLTEEGQKILNGKIGSALTGDYHGSPISIKVASVNAPVGAKFAVVKYPLSIVSDGLSSGLSVKEKEEGTGVLELGYTSSSPASAQDILKKILTVAIQKDLKERSEEAGIISQFIASQLPGVKNDIQRSEDALNQFDVKFNIYDTKSQARDLMMQSSNIQEKLQQLSVKKTMLLDRFTENHPYITAITEQEKRLEQKSKQIKTQLSHLPATMGEELNLERDIKIQNTVYANMLAGLQKIKIDKAGVLSNIRLLSDASYPVFPLPNNTRKIIFGSFFFGFIVSLGVIFIKFLLSPIVDDPEVVERKLGLSVMGILPFSEQQKRHNKAISRNKALNPAFLLAAQYTKEITVEALRSLRTAIQISLLSTKDHIISITGCSPSIGKSFISSNLAFLISELGKRVLIIDADMRLGKMHLVFGKQKNIGLSTYLSDKKEVKDVIQTVFPERLDFIAAGDYPKDPSGLLSKPLLQQLLNQVKQQYDLVIIDTPPVLAVTDPSLILCHSSVNLMVVGVAKNHIKEVEHAKSILEKSGVVLTGLIFNNLKSKKAEQGYSYGNYNYHYEYEK